MRRVLMAALWVAWSLQAQPTLAQTTAGQSGGARLGPSFDCQKVTAPLAQIICADPALSALDFRLNQTYWALLRQEGNAGAKSLKAEDVAFINDVVNRCGITGGEAPTHSTALPVCVKNLYEGQRQLWVSRLTGLAREEAIRPIEQHLARQAALQSLGFLPAETKIDGVYGQATRAAIGNWQASHGRAATGLLGDADAQLLEQDAQKLTPSAGNSAGDTPPGEGLTVAVTAGRTDSALIIKGEIRNETSDSHDVPKLRVAIRDAAGAELATKVADAPVERLDGGAAATFETSFDLNDQATGVAVTFVSPPPCTRHD